MGSRLLGLDFHRNNTSRTILRKPINEFCKPDINFKPRADNTGKPFTNLSSAWVRVC